MALPLLALLVVQLSTRQERQLVERELHPVAELGWEGVEVQHSVEEAGPEIDDHLVLLRRDGQPDFEVEATVNRDMFGTGFVRAADVDGDDERELAAYGVEGGSFYVDRSPDGQLVRLAWEESGESGRDLAAAFRSASVGYHLMIAIWVILSMAYWLVLGIGLLIAWLVRRQRGT